MLFSNLYSIAKCTSFIYSQIITMFKFLKYHNGNIVSGWAKVAPLQASKTFLIVKNAFPKTG